MSKSGTGGTKDRIDRVKQRRSGQWATISPDLLYLASKLYRLSEEEAKSSRDGNTSKMVFAGIPLLLSSLYALIIECESMGLVTAPDVDPMKSLPEVIGTKYGLSGEALKDFECLCEIRNEMVHPVPLPTGTSDNWPEYLRRIKSKKLLAAHPDPNTNYIFFGQLASHELFAWAVYVTYRAYRAVIGSVPDRGMLLEFFFTTFGNFAPEKPRQGQKNQKL
jgi:hypothetical protein